MLIVMGGGGGATALNNEHVCSVSRVVIDGRCQHNNHPRKRARVLSFEGVVNRWEASNITTTLKTST